MKIEIEVDERLHAEIAEHARNDSRSVEDMVRLVLERWVFGALGRDHVPPSQEDVDAFMRDRGSRPKREALTAKQRNKVFELCEGRCAYCKGAILYDEPWDVDHVIPVARGGTNDPKNLTLSCVVCNRKKGDKVVM